MFTLKVEGNHRGAILQAVDDLALVPPIILQGEVTDHQGGVQGGGALEVDPPVEPPVAPLVVVHGDEDVHLEKPGAAAGLAR